MWGDKSKATRTSYVHLTGKNRSLLNAIVVYLYDERVLSPIPLNFLFINSVTGWFQMKLITS